MKKLIATILTLALAVAMSTTTVFAAESSATKSDGGTQNIDVTAKYASGATTSDVVSVDVEWGAMQFTYSVDGEKVWNPADHTYTDNTAASWTADGNTVKVTNHSNVNVNVGFAFVPEATSSVTGSFAYDKTATENKVALTAGAVGAVASADSVTATLTLAGTVPATQTVFAKVGTITVTISAAAAESSGPITLTFIDNENDDKTLYLWSIKFYGADGNMILSRDDFYNDTIKTHIVTVPANAATFDYVYVWKTVTDNGNLSSSLIDVPTVSSQITVGLETLTPITE